jgi:hypothetical protein
MEMTLPGWRVTAKQIPFGDDKIESDGNHNSRSLGDNNEKGNSGVYSWSKKGNDSGKGARENCPCYRKRVRSSMSATFQWLPAVGPA